MNIQYVSVHLSVTLESGETIPIRFDGRFDGANPMVDIKLVTWDASTIDPLMNEPIFVEGTVE